MCHMSSGLSLLQRHVLACLFEPQSLLVVGSPHFIDGLALPKDLQQNAQLAAVHANQTLNAHFWERAKRKLTLTANRLDLAVICLPADSVACLLDGLVALHPRCVLVLRHQQPIEDYPRLVRYCRAWSQKHQSYVVGPEAFGIYRP